MKVLYASCIEKIETRADGTLKIISGTSREMSAPEMTALFSFKGQENWTLHSFENNLTEADVPDEVPDTMTGQKTKAQRLRAVVWRIWEKDGSKGNSEDYYNRVMENLIDQLKEKLE